MEKKELIYEGKSKRIFATEDPNVLLVQYTDEASAFNGLKIGRIEGKGVINNQITNLMMQKLESKNIPTHFLKQISERETLIKKADIIPLEVVVRNISAGGFCDRYGVKEGIVFDEPTVEFYYKKESMGNPLINSYHAAALKLAAWNEINEIKSAALKINGILKDYFAAIRVDLVNIKLEFGRLADGTIVLADEISPDSCRFWDTDTHEKLDKDRFRRSMGDVEDAYQELFNRILGK